MTLCAASPSPCASASSPTRRQIGEGSLYQALYRMELKGWIKAEWGVTENNRKAKYYKLTRTGRKQLEGEVSSYNRLTEAIAKALQTA
jgi:PadR family transcriptional regulator, regulatory protein PadR